MKRLSLNQVVAGKVLSVEGMSSAAAGKGAGTVRVQHVEVFSLLALSIVWSAQRHQHWPVRLGQRGWWTMGLAKQMSG